MVHRLVGRLNELQFTGRSMPQFRTCPTWDTTLAVAQFLGRLVRKFILEGHGNTLNIQHPGPEKLYMLAWKALRLL